MRASLVGFPNSLHGEPEHDESTSKGTATQRRPKRIRRIHSPLSTSETPSTNKPICWLLLPMYLRITNTMDTVTTTRQRSSNHIFHLIEFTHHNFAKKSDLDHQLKHQTIISPIEASTYGFPTLPSSCLVLPQNWPGAIPRCHSCSSIPSCQD